MTDPLPLLADRLHSDKVLVTAWSGIPDPQAVDTLARCGYDAVTLDMQHGQHTFTSLISGIAEIRAAQRHALVRVPLADWAMVSRALDAGAEAVIAPMINDADDARSFVAAAKYPPVGERSWGPLRAMALRDRDGQSYLEEANRACLAIAMIETPRAIDNLEAILAVKGIDGILLGPSDLSLTLSGGVRIDPSGRPTQEAIAGIARRARAAGKVCSIFCNSADDARAAVALGSPLIVLGVDVLMMQAGARTLLDDFQS